VAPPSTLLRGVVSGAVASTALSTLTNSTVSTAALLAFQKTFAACCKLSAAEEGLETFTPSPRTPEISPEIQSIR